jgi:hypothetical protein
MAIILINGIQKRSDPAFETIYEDLTGGKGDIFPLQYHKDQIQFLFRRSLTSDREKLILCGKEIIWHGINPSIGNAALDSGKG